MLTYCQREERRERAVIPDFLFPRKIESFTSWHLTQREKDTLTHRTSCLINLIDDLNNDDAHVRETSDNCHHLHQCYDMTTSVYTSCVSRYHFVIHLDLSVSRRLCFLFPVLLVEKERSVIIIHIIPVLN